MIILYVDDDGEDLELFEVAMREIDSSITCLLANTGREALRLLEDGLFPDMIFLDVNMPGMDGVTCLSKIRENEKFNETKVVLLTTSPYLLNRKKIESLSAGFLTKPNNYEDLVKILSEAVSNR
jgi:CheY-like chemotaxis protein